jgi:hypothetical protein
MIGIIYNYAPVAILVVAILFFSIPIPFGKQETLIKASVFIGFCFHFILFFTYSFTTAFFGVSDLSGANVARLYLEGFPLYGSPQTNGYSHSLLYGPLCFIPTVFSFRFFGLNIFSAKLWSIFQYASLLIGLLLLYRKYNDEKDIFLRNSLISLILSLCFFIPPEFYLITISCLYAFYYPFKSSLWRAAFIGISAGIAGNLRLHGLLYVLPSFFKWKIDRPKLIFYVFVTCLFLFFAAALPFFLPNISFKEYFQLLKNGGKHGFPVDVIVLQSMWLICLLLSALPLGCILRSEKNKTLSYFGALVSFISVILIFLISCKAGSGPHHLLSAFPILLFVSSIYKVPSKFNMKRLAICFVLSYSLIGSLRAFKNEYDLIRFPSFSVINDLNDILGKTNASVAIGFGSVEHSPWWKPSGLGRTMELGFLFPNDLGIGGAASLMDFQQSGCNLSKSINDRLLNSKIDFIVIPKDFKPFYIENWYTQLPLLDSGLSEQFLEKYYLYSRSKYFDIYSKRSM